MDNNLALVVFDMAGTTVNDGGAVSRAFREALGASGIVVGHEEVKPVMGLPKPEALRLLLERAGAGTGAGGASVLDQVALIHADFVARMLRFYAEDPTVTEFQGITAMFGRLRQAGVKIALNSGFSRDIARTIIDRLGWNPLIDASITSDEVPRGRPHPDMIQRLMSTLVIDDPRRVAKVGDTPVDLEEGTRAGCGRVIGVTWGTHTRGQLERSPHTHLVDQVPDLAAALGLDPA